MDNNLRNIINRQKDVMLELENEVKSIENSDLTKENEKLKLELEKLNIEYSKSENKAKHLSGENASLKTALYEQTYNEKRQMVNSAQQRLDIYFKSNVEGEKNRLTALENSVKYRIDNMASVLRNNQVDIQDGIYAKLGEVASLVNVRVTEAQAQLAAERGAFSANEQAEFERMKNEQITTEQVLAVTKKNNFERFVGLNLLNIIGILLIIIGAIAFASFMWDRMTPQLQGVMLFALGAIMLIGGELLNRKKPNIFSLGVTAGGVAVLYVALGASYFGLEILGMYAALGLCVLITTVAFLLSTRYNSQIILALALVGGYLPMFSLEGNLTMTYGAMAYFVILNLLALTVAFKKKWIVASYIGMSLNIIGTIFIIGELFDISQLHNVIAVSYILFAFLVYTLIPIVSTYASKSKFKKSDVVLISINTFFSSLIMFLTFYGFGWDNFTGALAIVFAVIYLGLGWLVEKKFDGEKHTRALFYLTGLAFVVLIIPFQFGRAWLTLGWLAQGVAITTYGILKDERNFKIAGWSINGLCLWAFLVFDLAGGASLFAWQYLAITLGSLIILGAYMYKKTLASGWQKTFKYLVIINLWFYAIYACNQIISQFGRVAGGYNMTYLVNALIVLLTFAIAYFAPRLKRLSDLGVKIISICLYGIGIIWLFLLNLSVQPIAQQAATPIGVTIIGTVVLILIGLLSVFAVRDLMKLIVMERKAGVEWYPLIVSGYFIIILTQNLITQYNLSFASMWISIIYVLTALAWIVFGFARRYSLIRKFGLGLALAAVAKLFLIDLATLTQGYRIITYFALGITLVAISFVYQYFNKRLELQISSEVTENEENN